uniref:EamA domain-containing protein n=1 Tax=Chromera velia CCMP2878 TaxID=1169474 RepID=A0A0G4F3Q0_9ALVE|eukprot:Cvel_14915.t1-p1 / transcript=Cvel_14915.t1 / gene=Cvel_14915 / organism=Chromera_velia_CCMP2878 / gene_product=Crt homolog 2, putative / transcript_product=Crt homolog 2, putative / location=Cvel_scaffold1080:53480-56981(+) / protein_length=414 / sequence_SO=supercontig / SO=protein_coding / is_pseudo=false
MMKAKGNRVANQDLEESLLPSDPQGKQAPELKVNVAPAVVGETEREDGNEHSKSKQGGLVGAITRSCRGDNLLLALYTLGLLFTSVGNSVFFKKMTNAMPNYSFFLNQLTSTVYIPIFFSLIWYADFSGKLSEEEKKFPKSRFLALGALDALAGICMLFGGVHTAGTLQVVFQQLTIPVTLIASGLLLRAKYHLWQILGALVILGGVVVVQLPVILGWDSSGDAFAGNSTTFNIIFSLSAVPMALSSVFKEVAFRGVSLDVNLLQGWVAFWQVLIGFVLLPLNTLPFLEDQKLEWKDIPESLWGGCKCLFAGVNTYGEGGKACGGPDQHPCDACGAAWIPVVVYLAFNVGYNVFMLLVIKYGSATLSFLVATLRLPLSSFAFYAPFIMGDDAQEFQWTDLAGLAVLLIGLVLYR